MKIRITKPAQKQIDSIAEWWRGHRDKAPERFQQELEDAMEFLRNTPTLAKTHVVRGSRVIRWVLLPKSQVKLYFWVNESAGFVRIVSAWGGRRGRQPKL